MLLITRYICAFILHLRIECEIEQAINMMKFTLYRTGRWSNRYHMFCVALMQLIGAAFTETVNMIKISKEESSSEIIQNLLAFGIIAEIDDYFAQSLKDNFPSAL